METTHSAMDDTILISTSWDKVLFDISENSFIFEDFVYILRIEMNSLERPLLLHTPLGEARKRPLNVRVVLLPEVVSNWL